MERYFMPFELLEDLFLLGGPGCLLGTNEKFVSLGLYEYNWNVGNFEKSLHENTNRQIMIDIDMDHEKV